MLKRKTKALKSKKGFKALLLWRFGAFIVISQKWGLFWGL
jgi:hypothetical protein